MPKRYYLIIPLVALAVGFVGRTLFYYRGIYSGPTVPTSQAGRFKVLSEPLHKPLPLEPANSTVLVDNTHRNNFSEEELTALFGRITAAGGRVEILRSGESLSAALRSAGAYVVIANEGGFGADQALAVEEFVNKGGHLLLVGDPTRLADVNGINSLAGRFGIIYQDDYLYNLVDNDGNYLNVILHNFAESDITKGVNEIVFQTAHSLRVGEGAIVLGDENTYSSLREQPGDVTAVALTADGRVLALPDLTFLTGPYNTFADNDRFIDNVVRFLLSSERTFELLDFPYFFSTPTDVVYTDTLLLDATFEDAVTLRNTLEEAGIQTELQSQLEADRPLIFLGLYDEADEEVLDLLNNDGITISDEPLSPENGAETPTEHQTSSQGQVTLEGVGSLERGNTALFHLHRTADGPYQLYVLASNEDTLSDGVSRLLGGDLANCAVTQVTALCALGEPGEEVAAVEEEQPETGPAEEGAGVLVISDDAASAGVEGRTSAELIRDALSASAPVALVSTREDGIPTAQDMLAYSAVFWSTGDYCCLAPSLEGTQAIMEYLDSGGALFISGANLSMDWAGSPFFEDYLGALDAGEGVQVDLEPGDIHPIAAGFAEIIHFEPGAENVVLGVIDTREASIVFRRGPDSEFPGEPSLIAHERDGARVAYAAFPLYFLSRSDLELLAQNALNWLETPGELTGYR